VGFIGLGNMGGHMARNLLKAGYKLTIFDINKTVVQSFHSAGAEAADSPKDLATKSDVIITMLPSSPYVREVYSGSAGILHGARPGSLLIDCSTIDPTTSKELSKMSQQKELHAIDAPVSGGVGGAEAGTLTFMVGGSKTAFDMAKPYLEKMGKNIVHCGDSGNGQVVKICNNMLLAITMVGTAETMNLGVKLGMDPKFLASIINTSTGRNWSCDTYNPCPGVMPNVPASRDYTGGFGSALMLKDLGLAVTAADESKSFIPLGELSQKIYQQMVESGYDKKDFSSVYKWLNENSGKLE